jgi:hypothetical protein
MNNSNDNYQKTLSFSSFFSGNGGDDNDISILKKAAERLLSKRARHIAPSLRTTRCEAVASPVIEPSVVSPYKVDDYGRPRILSNAEIVLHDVARWTVIAVMIGYGLAIALVAIQNFSALQPRQVASQPRQVASQETEP